MLIKFFGDIMANINVNVIGLNDQLGDNNIELSNVGGELVVNTTVDLNSTSQPKKVVTVTDILVENTTLYSNAEITEIPESEDTYFTDESVLESGTYLVEYVFTGTKQAFIVVRATGVATELSANKSFIYYNSKQIVTVVYGTSISDGVSVESTSLVKTLDTLTATFNAGNIKYVNSDVLSTAGLNDVKSVLTGTRKLTITKLS